MMSPPQHARPADAPQIKLSKTELQRLANRIEEDYRGAISDHEERMRRFMRYYQLWRNRAEPDDACDPDSSDFHVPILQWQVYSKWAKEHSSLFGSDAEVVAAAVGPDDTKRVRKVSRFQSWRLFNSMRIKNKAAIFDFRKILNGRSHAEATWVRETYDVPMADGSRGTAVEYDGPGFDPIWPDDFIVPAEDVSNLQQFSFVIRKRRRTPDQLLRGEDSGEYQGIRENFKSILNFAQDKRRRDGDDRVKSVKDQAEGVTYEGSLGGGSCLTVWDWYGKWRRLKGKRDAREDNLDRREEYETDMRVRYLPDLDLIIGVQDLAEMYPLTARRRPFVEAALVEDGSYWGPGFGELLEALEYELSRNHNLATRGGQFAIGPMIFYKPASGFDPQTFEYKPFTCQPTEDPQGIRVIEFRADLSPAVIRNQELVTYSERITGQTDMNIGRTQDRPNAPRTARQTMALLEEGDVRAGLDTSALREHWGEIISWFWALEQMYGSPRTFFRVTEEEAGGLFPTARGGAYLDSDDKTGRYDFDLKFATSATAKETKKQEELALYQLDLQNPLVVNNPRALWILLDKVHRTFGDDRFREIIPEPPDLDQPMKPVDEWTRMLEHEAVTVNPLDNDQLHIADHTQRLLDAAADPHVDPEAVQAMEMHVIEHTRQLQQKKLMAELTGRLAQSLQQPGGLVMPQASVPLQAAGETINQLIAAQTGQQQPGGEGRGASGEKRPPQKKAA